MVMLHQSWLQGTMQYITYIHEYLYTYPDFVTIRFIDWFEKLYF